MPWRTINILNLLSDKQKDQEKDRANRVLLECEDSDSRRWMHHDLALVRVEPSGLFGCYFLSLPEKAGSCRSRSRDSRRHASPSQAYALLSRKPRHGPKYCFSCPKKSNKEAFKYSEFLYVPSQDH